jgi:8-oxo-dGTP diphosphatase
MTRSPRVPEVTTNESFTVSQPRVAAGALFRDQADRVLLVKPNYKPRWDIPGGYVEPGETPRQACAREVSEELGLDLATGRLLVADWAPSVGEGDKLLFVFDGGILPSEQLRHIKLQADELEQYSLFESDAFTEVLTDRLTRRITAALDAARNGTTTYLEPTASQP